MTTRCYGRTTVGKRCKNQTFHVYCKTHAIETNKRQLKKTLNELLVIVRKNQNTPRGNPDLLFSTACTVFDYIITEHGKQFCQSHRRFATVVKKKYNEFKQESSSFPWKKYKVVTTY
jgi:hypothetical protein